MSAKRYSVTVDGRTYEGKVSSTPKHGLDIMHVRGPMEWKRPLHHALNLTEWKWVSTPLTPALGTGTRRGPEFIGAGWEMANQWMNEQEASRL